MPNRRVEIDELDDRAPVSWFKINSQYAVFCQLQHSSEHIRLGRSYHVALEEAYHNPE